MRVLLLAVLILAIAPGCKGSKSSNEVEGANTDKASLPSETQSSMPAAQASITAGNSFSWQMTLRNDSGLPVQGHIASVDSSDVTCSVSDQDGLVNCQTIIYPSDTYVEFNIDFDGWNYRIELTVNAPPVF